jgi:hypothetical protein
LRERERERERVSSFLSFLGSDSLLFGFNCIEAFLSLSHLLQQLSRVYLYSCLVLLSKYGFPSQWMTDWWVIWRLRENLQSLWSEASPLFL